MLCTQAQRRGEQHRSSYDVELGGDPGAGTSTAVSEAGSSSSSQGGGEDTGKPPESWRPLASWPPVRQSRPLVRQAAGLLDRACLLGGDMLGNRPGVRLGMAGYLLLVHLFVWFQLAVRHAC